MTATTTPISDKAMKAMQERYLLHAVYSGSEEAAQMHNRFLHDDGRTRRSVIAAGIKEGVLDPKLVKAEDYVAITGKVLESIPDPDDFDLMNYWLNANAHEGRWDNRRTYRFLRIGWTELMSGMTLPLLKFIYRNSSKFKWYLVDEDVLAYSRQFEEDKHQSQAYTLPEARAAWAERLKSGGRNRYEIVVSNDALEAAVSEFLFNKRVQEVWPKILPYALVWFNILSKSEAETVKSGDDMGGLILFHGLSSSHAGNDPEKWGEKLEKGIDGCIEQLAEIQQRLLLLRKIQKGVAEYGGWDKFRADAMTRLVMELRKEKSDGEKTEEAKA